MNNTIGCVKSHYSLGRSIITLEKPSGKVSYPTSIFDLLIENKLSTLVLVEDNISGLLQASKNAADNKIKLIFGLRMNVCNDVADRSDEALKKRAKYIVFAKNPAAYESMIKIWSFSAGPGFYHTNCIDFKTLKSLWNENLILTVPFYDSFLYLNAFHSHNHIPEFDGFGRVDFFTEDNNLPFDEPLTERVVGYCSSNSRNIVRAQSIFYKAPEDFLAYMAFRCIHSRSYTGKVSLEKPELNHMSSNEFNFDKWLNLK